MHARRLTPELVKRIYEESPTAMQEILKFLAAHPEQEFSTRDLGQALSNTDIKPNTVAGTFGAFGASHEEPLWTRKGVPVHKPVGP